MAIDLQLIIETLMMRKTVAIDLHTTLLYFQSKNTHEIYILTF